MRIRFTMMAVCVLLATMMFGGTAFAVLGLPSTHKYTKIGDSRGDGWMSGQHNIISVGNELWAIVWEANPSGGDNLVVNHSIDAGITWADRKYIVTGGTSGDGYSMAVDPSTKIAHVIWVDAGYMYYANTADTTPITVTATNAYFVRVVVDSAGIPHIVYEDGGTNYTYFDSSSSS